ncbi:archaeosortase A [Halapricum sp. CBA1109]|uniref:archaeosortase A n=1 Tax=Halapricum sp. CBA1109 TaxID=2668068 RepID=UPI0018D205C8|nr:archaeosortase A [Halapricum sp. CBA1109]
MTDGIVAPFAALYQYWGTLAWTILVVFLAGIVLERYDKEYARSVFVVGWAVLSVLWVASIYQFIFDQKSITEGIGVLVGIPLSLWIGYLLASGRDQLRVLSRAVGVMWLVYLPASTVDAIRSPLIDTVTGHTAWVLSFFTTEFSLVEGSAFPSNVNAETAAHTVSFLFQNPEQGYNVVYTIQLACTGLGSVAIFAGLIAAVQAPLRRKLKALGAAVAIIYVLNIARNVFIAYSFGLQKMHLFPDAIVDLFALTSTYKVSYILADRIIAQFLSVVALVGITYVVVKLLPEVLTIVEEGIYVFTRKEYDLRQALDVGARTDGGSDE